MEKKQPAQFIYDDSAQGETIQQISESYTSGEVAEQNATNQENQVSQEGLGNQESQVSQSSQSNIFEG
ncbi:hypothetical protein [Peribacillus alkalitolerans]|uniref:hypothetical protein n=1 Tax=Peribacillus alkalitolerans TaxID=1550385 RepID=UPI0013D85AC4|nr:hypothetical protein [Peribacillus alkalitolerans]